VKSTPKDGPIQAPIGIGSLLAWLPSLCRANDKHRQHEQENSINLSPPKPGTIVEEAAKDTYTLFKNAFKRVVARQPNVRFESPGRDKLSLNPPGSVGLFIELAPGAVLRFLFDRDPVVAEESIEALFRVLPDLIANHCSGQPLNTVFRYSSESDSWFVYDPMSERRHNRPPT
jgi:hypothetical protein